MKSEDRVHLCVWEAVQSRYQMDSRGKQILAHVFATGIALCALNSSDFYSLKTLCVILFLCVCVDVCEHLEVFHLYMFVHVCLCKHMSTHTLRFSNKLVKVGHWEVK